MADPNISNKPISKSVSEDSVDESPPDKIFVGQGHEKEVGQRALKPNRRQRRKKKNRSDGPLSWDERQLREERECQRAVARRESLAATGHPMAPYNTTQFLMEDRNQNTPDLRCESPEPVFDGENVFVPKETCTTKTPDSSMHDELTDFSHTYQDVHTQYLLAMPKEKIVQHYMELETKVEQLEKKLRSFSRKHRREGSDDALSLSPNDLSESELLARGFGSQESSGGGRGPQTDMNSRGLVSA